MERKSRRASQAQREEESAKAGLLSPAKSIGVVKHENTMKNILDEMFASRRKLLNAAALEMASNLLVRQKSGLFALNLCAMKQLKSSKFFTAKVLRNSLARFTI